MITDVSAGCYFYCFAGSFGAIKGDWVVGETDVGHVTSGDDKINIHGVTQNSENAHNTQIY